MPHPRVDLSGRIQPALARYPAIALLDGRRCRQFRSRQCQIPRPSPTLESASQEQAAASLAVHPIAIEIAIAAALWFIAVTWLAFAHGVEIDYLLAIVTLFFVIFFALFLLHRHL